MARRTLASRLPSWTAGFALALSILCCLILSGSVPAASARHSPKKADAVEPSPAPPAAQEPAVTDVPTVAPATKRLRARGQASSPASAVAPSSPAGDSSPAGSAQRHATRLAERRARHQAEQTGQPGATGNAQVPAAAGVQAQAQAEAKSKTRREHEREREQRRRERERKAEGHETRKEREAREGREAQEGKEAGGGPPVEETAPATVASNAPAPTPAPAGATTGSPLPTVVGETPGRATGSSRPASGRGSVDRARRAAKRSGSALASRGAGPAEGIAGASVAAKVKRTAARHSVSRRPTPTRKSGAASQLVTSVTKIIGVVPTLLWLLVGALGLAAAVFFVSSRLAGRRAVRLERQRQALLEDVGLLQGALLPELPPRIGPVTTTAAYRPASGPAAGGDFYDVLALPDGQLAVIVGDVSGHGREALPHTTLLRFTLRAYLEAGLGPRESLRTAAPVLERQLGGSFATVVLAVYNPRERTLTYACAGHPHPLLSGLPSEAPITACAAPPIGASRVTGTRQTVIEIPGEALVCFYTDGVIEARVGEELFGVERLDASLQAIAETATAASLLDRVRGEADRRPDDMAACMLRIEGDGTPPVIRSEELEVDLHELQGRRVRRFLDAAGLDEETAESTLQLCGRLTAEDGSALLNIRLDEGSPAVSVTPNNVAPFRARSIVRPKEVAV